MIIFRLAAWGEALNPRLAGARGAQKHDGKVFYDSGPILECTEMEMYYVSSIDVIRRQE